MSARREEDTSEAGAGLKLRIPSWRALIMHDPLTSSRAAVALNALSL